MENSIKILLIFFISPFLFFPPTVTTSTDNVRTDLHPLLAFKSSLRDPHGALSSWNETTPFCSWNGVGCGRRHPNRVVEINLMSQGLVGPLSPHIGNLSFLKTIILQNNTFHGPIPTQISLLKKLRIMDFSNNSFTGPIPTNLSALVFLNLIDNNLSGTIPAELGSMSKLEVLALSENNLSGTTPPSIGNITSLKKLSLLSCGLQGEIPESLAKLHNLNFFQLGDNGLTGHIPSGLFNISSMQYFSVLINKLEGVIPSTVGLTLPNLKGLFLWGNQFTGPIPASISNASFLEYVELNNNKFTGQIPRASTLTNLLTFIFASNNIVDNIDFISSLTNSTNLEVLQVSENQLTGSLPESIANLSTQLDTLTLDLNNIHGNIPSGIENLIGLTSISLAGNYLEGAIPAGIAKLSNLHELFWGGNEFTNELPSSLGNLTFLNRLYLNRNKFFGNVPPSLGNCTNLLVLDLSHNSFNGMIPREIVSLSSVSIAFDLSHNAFEGSIPYEVGSLTTSLTTLDLSNNRLSGVIPNTLSRCTSLQELYLNGNLLDGEIPSGLGDLMGLQKLDLSRNNLSGPIPSFLGKLKLENLNLSFNKLQGEVPTIGVFGNTSSFSLESNGKLCGGILQLQFPPCSQVKSKKKNLSTLLKILIPILAIVVGICLILFALFTYKKRKLQENVTPSMSSFTDFHFMRLSYADLLKATGGFSESNLLGVGSFGTVYKGILDEDQTLVAVKVLDMYARGASKSFIAECNALRNVRHKNLLKILSVCESIDFQGNGFKAIVYEFKANGSLEKWLYGSKKQEGDLCTETTNLSMIQRLNIAIDIAQAIEYLHCGTYSTIVHGDLKPNNILLDHDMTACVGDFGLAKIVSDRVSSHESNSSIGIRGTLGYVPPEYGTTNSVSTQGDVYSYGIVLLEMFTNKRPTDDLFMDHVNLHNFVSAALPDRVMEIVDPQIRAEKNNDKIKDCMTSILSIGVCCSEEIPKDRMLMNDVLNELYKIKKLLSY